MEFAKKRRKNETTHRCCFEKRNQNNTKLVLLFLLSSYISRAMSFVATTASFSTGRQQQQQPVFRNNDRRTTKKRVATTTTMRGGDPVQQQREEDRSVARKQNDNSNEFPHSFVAKRTRGDFRILSTRIGEGEKKDLVYLDSAATSQKPRQVLQKLDDYYTKTNSNVHRGAHTLSREATAEYESARDKIAKFVNANNRNEIVFTSGATEAINLVAMTYGRQLQEGDEIVTTESEHHSNLVPWQIVAKEKNLTVRYAKIDRATGRLDLEHLKTLLHPTKTKLVTFQHVSNVVGCINPVGDTIVPMVRSMAHPDCRVLLDACQSVPHMGVDVRALGVDFLAASGHKMCGPTGIGFLWGKEDLLNDLPPFMGGGEMIDTVTLEGSTFAKAPGRFEAGTPQIAQAIGLGAAVDYLSRIGMDNIERYEHELGEYLFARLKSVPGVTVLGGGEESTADRAALCSFVCDGVHPSDLGTFLDLEGVAIRAGHHCCQPLHAAFGISHSARASLYFYNTKEDIDFFIESLKNTIRFFSNLQNTNGETTTTAVEGNNNNDALAECAPVVLTADEEKKDDEEEEFVPFV